VAAAKVREKAADAAKRHARAATDVVEDAVSDAPPRPCDVGLVFALRIESGDLEDLLQEKITVKASGFTVIKGTLNQRRVAIAVSGPGRKRAAKATDGLVSGHPPACVISTGFAGGLRTELKLHDVLIADSLADVAGNRLPIDLKGDAAGASEVPGVHVGRLVTADKVIRLPEEKLALGEKHAAAAVDMETFAVAEACRREGIPFLSVRVISDTVDETLPPDLHNLISQQSPAGKLGAVAGALWRRPSSVKDMYRLRENALMASERLAKFLAEMIAGL